VEPAHSLHSHAAGVTKAGAGRHIGFALKQNQRAWAIGHGLTTVTWTYDPLVRRNAFFNVTRLGARPVEYLVDFYGEMTDAINAGQGSDRLMVHWDLTSDAVARCATRSIAEPESPTTPNPLSDNHVRYVQVPADIELMRREDPTEARRWRMAVRETLGGLLATGWSVVSVSREGYYELRRVG
jgi:predicted GNAT superfamily acetyltransferase